MVNKDLNGIGIIIGIAGAAYGIYTSIKMNKLSEQVEKVCAKIDKTIDEVVDDVEIDIPVALVEKAVEKAVDREVSKQTEHAASVAVREVKSDISKQVRTAVEEEYTDISKRVSDEITKQVEDIDIRLLKKEVRVKAEQKILDKFEGELDDLTDKYNNELRSVSKIYKSIEEAMRPREDKSVSLKLS